MAKSKYEKTIRRLRYHLEHIQKCYEVLLTLPLVDDETKQMMKQLCKNKSAEIACLDQIVADVYDSK